MRALLVAFFLLALLLTGLFIPALVAGGWILLLLIGVGLVVATLRWLLAITVGLPILAGGALLREIRDSRSASAAPTHPMPGDPDYLDWANREGAYSAPRPRAAFHLSPAPARRRFPWSRPRVVNGRPEPGHPDYNA
ncbi:hypothetical protein GGQ86_003032 [Xanthobacter flavus]|uniref:Uncharacterized protein n=1 Tax=Xanthobacter flavus TaxID=281 RepID=A0A9W6FMH6_XANFL|nr:hypothetical protein [Xanthobacter flavus]MDR6334550.1 hypothetical protein [Xanthobacter flavus]GLI23432.1 hypothetical protein XFLAVUS301_31060 [Xanthobacter flavus]